MKKKIILIFFLIFNLNFIHSFANDINEIELDGMSLGDSLLNFYSKEEIKDNKINYFPDERQYFVIFYNKNLSRFDDMEIYLKTNDKNYTMRSINAGLYPKSLKECIEIKDKIKAEISSALNLKFIDASYNHNYYTNSFIKGDVSYMDGGFISLDCMFFDEKDKKKFPNLVDNLSVTLTLDEINKWIEKGYK
tara:strand:- start:559 stop:1134 length:576 start_codon:yes stop_codon:yes gene_type:complete